VPSARSNSGKSVGRSGHLATGTWCLLSRDRWADRKICETRAKDCRLISGGLVELLEVYPQNWRLDGPQSRNVVTSSGVWC